MVGRQLRSRIAADGSQVLDSGALSKDCMVINLSEMPATGKRPLVTLTNLVSPTPNESHVFLTLLHRVPFVVATSLGNWLVVDGKISYLGARH